MLRSGQAAALDVYNLIEELEGLTRRNERSLGSQLKRIMAARDTRLPLGIFPDQPPFTLDEVLGEAP